MLIRRRFEPLAGQLEPAGRRGRGRRDARGVGRPRDAEETGLQVEVGPVIEVFDRITRDADGRVQYHFVLVDYLCWPVAGELHAGSDVDDAALVAPADLAPYELTAKATAVIERALHLAREVGRAIR